MRFDPSTEEKRNTYFRMIECIVPRPIAWVSTLSETGTPNLAPFSFFTGVTSSPPTLLFCAGNTRDGAPKDTPANIVATGEFVVNLTPHALVEKMVQTSAAYPRDVDEFVAAGVTSASSELVAPPRVAESPIAFECRLHHLQEIRDDSGRVASRIVIGRILLIHLDDEILDADGRVDLERFSVVSRLGGKGYALVGERFEVPHPRLP